MDDDAFRQLAGDENAKVSITLSRSDSDYGNGFSASVMVILTCDQSAAGLEEASFLARELAVGFLEPAYSSAEEFFKATKKPTKKRSK